MIVINVATKLHIKEVLIIIFNMFIKESNLTNAFIQNVVLQAHPRKLNLMNICRVYINMYTSVIAVNMALEIG